MARPWPVLVLQLLIVPTAMAIVAVALLAVAHFPNPLRLRVVHQPGRVLDLDGVRPFPFNGGVAWVVAPARADGVLAVLVHGRSGALAENVPLAARLLERGHGVLLFDMPGCGQHAFRPLASNEMAVQLLLRARALARHVAPDARLVYYGHSLGGLHVLQAAQHLRDVRVFVTDGAPYSRFLAALNWVLPPSLMPALRPGTDDVGRGNLAAHWVGVHAVNDTVVPVAHLDALGAELAGAWRSAHALRIGGDHYEPLQAERVAAVLGACALAAE